MNTNSSHTPTEHALVLGGGGAAGNAWLIGVLAGLADGGVDVTDADLIVGTSAGATAAAQITGAPIAELYAATQAPVPQHARPAGRPGGFDQNAHLDRMRAVIASAGDAADMRRKIGAVALEADAAGDGTWSQKWRTTVAARLPSQDWPDRRLLITAVDPVTGEGIALDRDSGVSLADAVAASTSNGFSTPAYRVGDRAFIDGGYRRNENADLAAGCATVLVLSPLGGRTMHPLEWGMQLSAQVDELRAGGSAVETVLPDEASLAAFGGNMMNLATRPAAARAGFAQGAALAARLTAFWG
ncbi:patatin-like phospholipase family protein [Gryllotalpicola daejeonensis]|uniref:Patatin-like phospholipase family protein n=1 Tax=Gryllotalpicola daejeonensis TaxID=993087 RepID=A0ABP7ZNT1_9MICO